MWSKSNKMSGLRTFFSIQMNVIKGRYKSLPLVKIIDAQQWFIGNLHVCIHKCVCSVAKSLNLLVLKYQWQLLLLRDTYYTYINDALFHLIMRNRMLLQLLSLEARLVTKLPLTKFKSQLTESVLTCTSNIVNMMQSMFTSFQNTVATTGMR